MENGIKPETSQENAIELERMKAVAESWGMPNSVYKGKTNDIDLSLIWFCPHCFCQLKKGRVVVHNRCAVHESYRTSKLEPVYERLYCPAHPEICEYDFWNKDLRRAAPSWWSIGFKYPLNPMQLHQIRIESVKGAISNSTDSIRKHKANIKAQKQKLIELENLTIEVQASMLG